MTLAMYAGSCTRWVVVAEVVRRRRGRGRMRGEAGEIGRVRILEGFVISAKNMGIYSKANGKSLNGFT